MFRQQMKQAVPFAAEIFLIFDLPVFSEKRRQPGEVFPNF